MTREYQRLVGNVYDDHGNIRGHIAVEQIAICTNDAQCQAAADEHNPDCPIEQQLTAEFNF